MKKLMVLLAMLLVFSVIPSFGADYVTATVTAQNTFTNTISPAYNTNTKYMAISISNTWVGTVTLQKSYDSGVSWVDVDTWTSNTEEFLYDPTPGILYKIGMKTGEFTSGTAVLRLHKGE